jgi:serine/threonine protein kinase
MTEPKKPPAFYCPACGQKHRADLSQLQEEAGAAMQLACAGCAIRLKVTLDDGGLPACTRFEADEPAPDASKPAAPVPRKQREKEAKKGTPDAPVSRKKREKKKAKPKPEAEDEADEAPDDAGEPAESPEPSADEPGIEREDESQDAEFAPGDAIGRYTVEGVVGKGGSSTVYAAFDPTTNRSVAMKVLVQDAPETIRTRFLREIEVQANIRHQNIMPVFDRGELEDGRPYFTMELLYKPWTLEEIVQHREQGSLTRYATLKKLADVETLIREVFIPVADGVYVANVENGVIHRDLKPENVLVDSRTLRPYVIDFGICHVLERKSGFASKAVIPPTTEAEGIVGTPRYLAPEQVRGNVHARTDVWGLGATLHFIVAGEPPLAASTPISRAELRRRIKALEETKNAAIAADDERKVDMCEEKLVRLTDPNLRTIDDLFKDARDANYSELPASTPAALAAVIAKAMASATADRYVNARQFGTELQAWLSGARVRALAEVGGTAAAVETARRAVSAHKVTVFWLLAGLAVGVLLGWYLTFVNQPAAPPSTRLDDAERDIKLLEDGLGGLARVADSLTAVERNRLWAALDARGEQIRARLADEPDVPDVEQVRHRLAYVCNRFAAPRVRIDVGESANARARDLVTGEVLTLRSGENALPPGAYEVRVPGVVRFPIEVPLRIRKPQDAEAIDLEPPLATYRLPLAAGAVPAGMVLVLEGRVLPRDLPFSPPASAEDVDAFLMDEAEVTNSEYAQFLRDLPLDERKARTPQVAFVPDSELDGAPVVVPGREDAPVVGIRPEDAMAYAAWRSAKTGARVRLPTETEWVLAAGARLGHTLPNRAAGHATEADFASPLRDAGSHAKDVSPFGVRGMLGNAREMVTPHVDDLPPGAVLVKGAGVGDDPDQGAIYIQRVLPAGERHGTTGFRCVQEISAGD